MEAPTVKSLRLQPSLSFVYTCLGMLFIQATSVRPQNISAGNSGGLRSDDMFRSVWQGYEVSLRPLCGDHSTVTTVAMNLALRQLQEVDEPQQILTTNLWGRVTWSECRLMWNMSEWNLSRLTVPNDKMWTPDLTLYDNADSKLSGVDEYRLIIQSDGTVLQQFPLVIKSLCQLDVSRFPFDTQTCNLTFGSWSYHGYEINLTAAEDPVDLGSYVQNGEWELISFTAQRVEIFFSGFPYPQVIFTLVLRRRHLFYILSLLFPCALIQTMAALAFLLPCETNEKVGLEITVLLSLAVMELVVLDMIPASSETLPLIGIFFMLAMIVVSLSCLMTVAVLAIHYPNRHRPLPPWARAILDMKITRWLGVDTHTLKQGDKLQSEKSILGILDPDVTANTPCHHQSQPKSKSRQFDNEAEVMSVFDFGDDSAKNSDVANVSGSFDALKDSLSHSIEGERSQRMSFRPLSADAAHLGEVALPSAIPKETELQEITDVCQKILNCITAYNKRKDHHKFSNTLARREWEVMAILLDRVFLIVYCVLTATMYIYVYTSIA